MVRTTLTEKEEINSKTNCILIIIAIIKIYSTLGMFLIRW